MDRDEIIRRVHQLSREQLLQLQRLLDQLEGHPENQTREPMQDQEVNESGK